MAEFKWYGHNCFRIRAKEATVLTDPVGRGTGYLLPKQTADVVTLSDQDPANANVDAIKPEFTTVSGPGEYEVHDVFVTGIRTYRDTEQGRERGHNTVYLIEIEGMRVGHLGDLGHPLSEEQAEAMANVDVLLVPVGGGDVLEPAQAAEIIGQLEPKIVVPMRFATAQGDRELGTLEPFCKELGVEVPVPIEKLVVRQADLAEALRVTALEPDGEGRR